MEQAIQRAKILVEALPYIRDFRGKRIVVKYGGHAMVDPELKKLFAQQIILFQYIGIQVVVVHGGGPRISSVLAQMGIKLQSPQLVQGVPGAAGKAATEINMNPLPDVLPPRRAAGAV